MELPERLRANIIDIEPHPPFIGYWITHYHNKTQLYSLGETQEKFFVFIYAPSAKWSSPFRQTPPRLEWFESREALAASDLPEAIKKAAQEKARWYGMPAPKPVPELADKRKRIPIDERDPTLPTPPKEPCPQCGCRQYWRAVTGPFTCHKCKRPKRTVTREPDVEEWWYVVA